MVPGFISNESFQLTETVLWPMRAALKAKLLADEFYEGFWDVM